MSATMVSPQEYLDTDYSPDREYVDGLVVKRKGGERPHSEAHRTLLARHSLMSGRLDSG